MIPTEGLIWTLRGQMILAVIALVVGVVAWIALTIVVFVRKAPPGTTQVDQVTGVKDHGIGWWASRIALFTVAPPVVFMVLRTVVAAVDMTITALAGWWPIIGIGAAVIVGALLAWRLWPRELPAFAEQPVVYAQPEPQPAPRIWSAPPVAGNWADPQP